MLKYFESQLLFRLKTYSAVFKLFDNRRVVGGIDYNGNVVRYKELKTGNCTAYYGGGITATGRPAQVGNVAVNPYVIPYGTRMYICSPDGSFVYGYAVAADTGGVLMSGYGLIDCYYDTYEECCNFGLRYMHVYILE